MPDKQPHHNPLTSAEKKVLVALTTAGSIFVGFANHMAFGEAGTYTVATTVLFSSLLLGTPTRTEGSIAEDLVLDIQRVRTTLGERIGDAVSFVASHLDRRHQANR